jgi:hypothetical protein
MLIIFLPLNSKLSGVFSTEPAEAYRPSMRYAEGKSHSNSNVFDDGAPQEAPTARPETVGKNASQIAFGGDTASDAPAQNGADAYKSGKRMDASRRANDTHFSFGNEEPAANTANASVKTQNEFDPVQRPSSRTAKANIASVNIFSGGDDKEIGADEKQNQMMMGMRPSSRVLNAPGGQQSFNIFGGSAAPAPTEAPIKASGSYSVPAPEKDANSAAGFSTDRAVHTSSRTARANQVSASLWKFRFSTHSLFIIIFFFLFSPVVFFNDSAPGNRAPSALEVTRSPMRFVLARESSLSLAASPTLASATIPELRLLPQRTLHRPCRL